MALALTSPSLDRGLSMGVQGTTPIGEIDESPCRGNISSKTSWIETWKKNAWAFDKNTCIILIYIYVKWLQLEFQDDAYIMRHQTGTELGNLSSAFHIWRFQKRPWVLKPWKSLKASHWEVSWVIGVPWKITHFWLGFSLISWSHFGAPFWKAHMSLMD